MFVDVFLLLFVNLVVEFEYFDSSGKVDYVAREFVEGFVLVEVVMEKIVFVEMFVVFKVCIEVFCVMCLDLCGIFIGDVVNFVIFEEMLRDSTCVAYVEDF